ncbi:hypothetical protein M8J77_015019 [Diaphorina citri]|nr:hypothetical protein M8J77_015019 [Diaphorina citri]
MDEVCDDEFNTENEGQSQRDVHVSKERMDDDADDDAYIKSLIEHTWEKPLVIKPFVDNPVVNKPLADKPLVDNPSIEKPSKRSPLGGGVGSDTYYSMHSSQCQLEKVLADDLTRKVSSRIESGGYERDSYVTAPELNMSELNEALSEQDGLIQEYTERLNQVNQELQVAKQTHKQLIRQLSHAKNEPSPMINSILKDMPPLDGKSLNRYLEELEWESYKYEPHTEIPEDVECDSAMLVENARRKYTLFNECISKVYPQVALAPLQWECKSESTSQASAPTCCQEVKEQIHDIHMYNCEQLEEFYVRQQACLDKLKAKYATMLGELEETVRDAIEKKNAKVRYCKTLQHVMAFTETEVLVVENDIRQHYTELILANKRLAFYLSQQRALCSEASDLIAQSEREVEEVKSLRKALCDEEHYARNLQLETECIESLLRRAQDIYCALCRSIEPLDVDIKRLMYNLVRLKKNICREKKCMRRLMKRRVQDLNKMQSMMSEIQTKQNPWKVNVGEIVEEVATKVKYEQMEENLEDVKPIGRGPCEPLIQDNDMATGTDSDAMSFAILIIT